MCNCIRIVCSSRRLPEVNKHSLRPSSRAHCVCFTSNITAVGAGLGTATQANTCSSNTSLALATCIACRQPPPYCMCSLCCVKLHLPQCLLPLQHPVTVCLGSTLVHHALPPCAGVLQVSCWASCLHDILADWAHDHSTSHASCSEHTPTRPTPTSSSDIKPQWVPATAPAADSFHLVFAANAGLPVYGSWVPTLQALAKIAPANAHSSSSTPAQQHHSKPQHTQAASVTVNHSSSSATAQQEAAECCSSGAAVAAPGVPVLFSDYCEEAVFMSGQLVQHVLGRPFDLQCCLNPFRDPVPATAHGTRLPACSNGFLFGWV